MVTNISMSLVNMLYNLQLVKYAGYDGVVAYGIIMYVGFILSALTSATRSELLRLSDTTTAQEIPMS